MREDTTFVTDSKPKSGGLDAAEQIVVRDIVRKGPLVDVADGANHVQRDERAATRQGVDAVKEGLPRRDFGLDRKRIGPPIDEFAGIKHDGRVAAVDDQPADGGIVFARAKYKLFDIIGGKPGIVVEEKDKVIVAAAPKGLLDAQRRRASPPARHLVMDEDDVVIVAQG